ncbi:MULTISPECIES: lambda exonuclease family protein [Bartonella]|uniref:Phage-related exonuclease n=2 Tax=Bartonella TaxID=773 RepID=E6YZ82_BARSR|nr:MULTISPECIES: lambda exonuclease family protein [Bartonella]AQX30634.1 putative phage-type endonuclease [Bartonella schoenbuchensis R1]AQX31140.1 putative phage-type endonuclease [Bartonella schoenbuchensis R1]MBA9083292.1 exodeoxyribonuclease (lambda-induced) [Bartonella chomelii]CBI82170.1 Phage-related exonuclease [Bartonella schoenbuchensis R1]CBI82747.1 Phage-related exonuclease [Bartonella schoenbuchensis R1]
MEQRTPEWFQARLGKVTASNINSIVDKTAKGSPTSKYEEYKLKLIGERLTGITSLSYETHAMRWGRKYEDSAIQKYSLRRLVTVTRCGFIPHPTIEMAGASPDGLIGDEGLIEVKCPQLTTYTRFLLDSEIKPEYILQMQFQMACTGRKWCDFVSYNPLFVDKSPHLCIKVQRVQRDDEQIERINKAVETFLEEIEQETRVFTQAA